MMGLGEPSSDKFIPNVEREGNLNQTIPMNVADFTVSHAEFDTSKPMGHRDDSRP